MQRDIRHQFILPHPPEVVWEYLTKAELLALWLMPNDFEPRVGHKFRFRTKPKKKAGFDGTVYCEVLEVVPCEKLVYSWKGGLSGESPALDSTVIWTLAPCEAGTVLQLEHSGFRGLKNYLAYVIMNLGWMKIGRRFSAKLQAAVHAS